MTFGLNLHLFQSFPGDESHCDWIEGTVWKLQREKDVAAGTMSAPVAKIIEKGFAHLILDWELLDAPAFGALDSERLVPPIEVIQTKARDLTGP
nr:hypothetical protein [Granulicella sp. L46]